MHLAPSTRGLLAAGLAGVCLLLAGTPVSAGPATDHLREFFKMVDVIIHDPATRSAPLEKVARVKNLVTDIADVRGAAAAALEREWDLRTPAERDEFTRLFAELLERGLVARLAGTVSPVNGMVMSWNGETRVGEETRVMTVVEARDGRKIKVEYRMIERRGHWLVRDVVVDGVSTIENYRSQFKRLLRQGSYAGLVKQLRAKLGEETLMFAQVPAPPAKWIPPAKSPEPVVAVRATPARVATRLPASTPAKAAAPAAVVATPSVVAKPAERSVVKATVSSSATAVSSAASPARHVAAVTVANPKTKAQAVAAARAVPPLADVVSPVSVIEVTTHLLPSVLLVMLGFSGVSSVVFLRRRASANADALVLQGLGDGDKRLVLVHPIPSVPKVRERGRKRRVVPAPRNPARHVDDAHRA
jgi:phospholipid transport system substrate-binding protein